MNKTSNVAFEIAQDIYTLSANVDTLFDQYEKFEITDQTYFKKLYVYACEANFIEGIVHAVKNEGYKFARYEKEVELLNSIIEDISNNFEIINVNSLQKVDFENLSYLVNKYKKYVPVEEISEEFEF